MTFRTRLLLIFTIAVVASVGLVEWLVSATTRERFERIEAQRSNALVAQFRSEYDRRGLEIARAVHGIAASDIAVNIAAASDYSTYYETAASLAAAHNLDLLELVAADGSIISSAQWPARFAYKEDWILQHPDWKSRSAFLRREELPDGVTLGLCPWPWPPRATAWSMLPAVNDWTARSFPPSRLPRGCARCSTATCSRNSRRRS